MVPGEVQGPCGLCHGGERGAEGLGGAQAVPGKGRGEPLGGLGPVRGLRGDTRGRGPGAGQPERGRPARREAADALPALAGHRGRCSGVSRLDGQAPRGHRVGQALGAYRGPGIPRQALGCAGSAPVQAELGRRGAADPARSRAAGSIGGHSGDEEEGREGLGRPRYIFQDRRGRPARISRRTRACSA